MELGGVPIQKKGERLIFYVCSSAWNWVSSMYKGIDGIDQFPLGSSDPGCLKFLNWRTFQEKKVP